MAIKSIFTGTFSFIGSSILSAQTTAAWQAEHLGDTNTTNTVRVLEQNAFLALIGAVVLLGLMWICSVWNACAELNQKTQKANRHFITLFILVAGLSTFCSSCSVEQQAMAARYRVAAEAEGRICAGPHLSGNHASMPFNNRYSSTAHSNLDGPPFCRFCGQRIYYNQQ